MVRFSEYPTSNIANVSTMLGTVILVDPNRVRLNNPLVELAKPGRRGCQRGRREPYTPLSCVLPP